MAARRRSARMTEVVPDEPAERIARVRNRGMWVIADQAVSSLANAGLTFVIARVVSGEEFGAFALAFSVYSFVIATAQGPCGQVLVIRFAGAARATQMRAAAAAGGVAVAAGAVAGLLTIAAGALVYPSLRGVLIAVGVLLPALVLQDMWRTAFVAQGIPRDAFVNDLLWTVLQAVAVTVLLVAGADRAVPFVLAWAGAALVAALVGARQNGRQPTFGTAARWLGDHRDVSLPSTLNALVILGAVQLAFVLIAALGGVDAVGALRAAQTLLGPLNIVGFAVASFVIPELVRRSPPRPQLIRVGIAVSVVLVVVDALWGTVLLLLPDAAGEALLGETWASARDTLPAMIAFTCLTGASVGATAVMRALNRVSYSVWVNAVLGPLILILSTIGAQTAGAPGAALGFVVAGASVLPLCWFLFARAVALGRKESAADPDDRAPGAHTPKETV
ncbi:hypothetical protein [Blastococcus sp. TF02A-26]|uniref:hypothetical protein n=1 Tax=Blastococcus sp. TF02A-26 TaxID=2250577 RepID=UPI000DE980A9|nr:hypothetical protein [Blastococcus sp. TF02A-26]RBY87389.1 hypothetical protein DQ240_07300 [Blastococcus sp. TF02A-26]